MYQNNGFNNWHISYPSSFLLPCPKGREGRRLITHSNTQRKVYHSMPLHTYTVNFATSSNLQEILLNSLFLHLFLLIMCEKNYAYTQHTPLKHYLLYLKHVNTQRKFYQSCRWGVAPRRTSVHKQPGPRRRGALVFARRWDAAAAEH